MFWNKNNKKEQNITQDKKYDLRLNIERQASVNIIKLGCSHYKSDTDVLQTALSLGLRIMEDLSTYEANYIREVNGRQTIVKLPNHI
jgi:hypothetical protein